MFALLSASFFHFLLFQEFLNLVDVGDIVGVSGTLKKTNKGEPSIVVQQYSVLSKAVHPFPDKFHGITDQNVFFLSLCVGHLIFISS